MQSSRVMRSGGRRRRRGAATTSAFVAYCALVLLVFLAAASPASASSATAATTVTCDLSPASVAYGGSVTVSGTVAPASVGETVVIFLDDVEIATTTTGTSGGYSVDITPARAGAVVATYVPDGAASAPATLEVRPKVTVAHGAVTPFLTTRFALTVAPASYTGVVTARVVHHGAVVATVKGKAEGGTAALNAPLRGIGRFTLEFSLPPDGGLAGRTAQSEVDARWKKVAVGSRGRMVRGLLTALARLKVRVPSIGERFTGQCGDSLVAFQKAYGLPRTRVAGGDDWRKLDRAKVIKPRHSRPRTHLEVDKSRQILLVVRNGVVRGYIPVSTGATGNTPEGSFRVRQKSPATSPFYGSGTLTWVMGFYADFAIHGYPDVPPYPASHGCIREPLWVAHWTYAQSFVGERLYVYR